MKPRQSTKDRTAGAVRTIKGKTKKVAGKLVGNPRLESEGKVEEVAGRVQRKGGEVERVLED
jgi:uncharacterized protein YjbJ (UPF0337 family)